MPTWTPKDRPEPDVLTGQYTRLERLDWDRHGDGLYAAVCGDANEDLWTYIPIGPFADRDIFQQIFEFVRGRFDWETMIVRDARSEIILGMASYMRMRPEHGSAEVGCVTFGPALKRTRQASEAMYLMARHLFDDLGYRRYEWKCDNANAASRRAAERFGFTFEGVFRNDMMVKGRSRDTAWYAMTDADWPLLKTGFETWLASENFDGAGRQAKRLEDCR